MHVNFPYGASYNFWVVMQAVGWFRCERLTACRFDPKGRLAPAEDHTLLSKMVNNERVNSLTFFL